MSSQPRTRIMQASTFHPSGDRMHEHRIDNQIHIQRAQPEVFAYVSQPWRWHEWHPASESASVHAAPLVHGDTFEEVVSMAPLPWLPLRIRRQMQWEVTGADAPNWIEMRGVSNIIEVRLRYQLTPADGTAFHRTFHYRIKGWLRHIERWLVLPKMQLQSRVALSNLKRRLEAA
jgi:hypothetical protein